MFTCVISWAIDAIFLLSFYNLSYVVFTVFYYNSVLYLKMFICASNLIIKSVFRNIFHFSFINNTSYISEQSNVTRHSIDSGHSLVQLSNFKILTQIQSKDTSTRKIAEALLIQKHKPTLNTQGASVQLKLF